MPIWKTEGPKDALALFSAEGFDESTEVFCNAMGAKEDPAKLLWTADRCSNEDVFVVHDADIPGQEGATFVEGRHGRRAGWTPVLASRAKSATNVVLPYPVTETRGKDLRDWLNEGNTYADLLTLAGVHEPSPAVEPQVEQADEHEDDPYRLSRENIKAYGLKGRALAFWRQEWYSWKGTHYEPKTARYIRNRLSGSIKAQFDAAAIQRRADGDEDCMARRVTTSVVKDAMAAQEELCLVKESQEMNSWLSGGSDEHYVAVKNGILNLTKLITDPSKPMEALQPHNKQWFSNYSLGYDYDPTANCPAWIEFVNEVFNGDKESIRCLQMWMGYLLTDDNCHNKMMFVIGKKRSGKGTICRAITELMGNKNIATPDLPELASQYGLHTLIDKPIGMITDARMSEKTDEIQLTQALLSITGGDRKNICRKYLPTLPNVELKIRFMLFSNSVPKFSDVSSAFMSRCIFLHTPNDYEGREDKTLGSKLSLEMSGILNWAIAGRMMLTEAGEFTQPKSGEKLSKELRMLMSPISQFVQDRCDIGSDYSCPTSAMYDAWVEWCEEHDTANAGSIQSFSRKLKATEPQVDTMQVRDHAGRHRNFVGIRCNVQLTSDFA